MYIKFIWLEWKAFFRSASVGRSIALKVFLGFIVLYFMLTFLILGLALEELLVENFPSEEPEMVVNRFLIYWFATELMMRFFVQSLPVLQVKPFLVQPVKRGSLVHYILLKSVFSWVNLFGPILFITFTISCASQSVFSSTQLFGWLMSILVMGLVLNFSNILIQKKFAENLKAVLPLLVLIAGCSLLEYYDIYSFTALVGKGFNSILENPVLVVIPLMVLVVLYRICYQFLRKNLYMDAVIENSSSVLKESDLSWTQRFGKLAPFLQLDLRLMWRNKRTKTTVYLAILFLVYGMLFYPNPEYRDGSSMLVLVGILTTGIFVINFGQFIPAWDSNYFSLLMSQPISWKLYLNSKVLLMTLSVLILTILSTPYVYFGWEILIINVACGLYNMGVNIPVVLYFGANNKKRIELDKNQVFNYQGMGITQWIVGLPLMILPIFIWGVASVFVSDLMASIILAAIGVLGIVFRNMLINSIADVYKANKYKMVEGFNQSSE